MDSRRRTLLVGKLAGLAAFWAAAATAAAAIGTIVAAAFAGSQGIDTAAWATGDGVIEGLSILVNVAASTIVWGLFGALLAMISRSAAISIAAGVGYFLIAEQLILQSLWPSTGDWLPAGTLSTLASGGSPTVSFTAALALAALYGAAAYAVTSIVFERRDVTD